MVPAKDFKRRMAHGTLIFSVGVGMTANTINPRAMSYGYDHLRFIRPVFIGDTIHVRIEVLQKEARPRGRRGVIHWQRQIINQEGKVVQEGVSVTLVEGKAPDKEKDNATDAGAEETRR